MGQSTVYFCEDCGFEVTETSTIFCLDFESMKVEELSLGMWASNFIAGKVNGHVYITYCNNCQSMVKRFVISENEFGINEGEIANFILDNYEGNELITVSFINGDSFEEYQISDNLNGQLKSKKYGDLIECPNCGKNIPSSFSRFKNCPKCGSKDFIIRSSVLFD
ncbi:hypothetical protein [Methanobrevibacter boviskoreani]|uniref:hypothetical protein n=1 Tax=Methanobrevibacter boviskoreani TaxID=1348249 RepID=UPI000592CB77|nr:hypothetical protein [Methanobrevibacter boviskoreani]